jgi:hypothetical protein
MEVIQIIRDTIGAGPGGSQQCNVLFEWLLNETARHYTNCSSETTKGSHINDVTRPTPTPILY